MINVYFPIYGTICKTMKGHRLPYVLMDIAFASAILLFRAMPRRRNHRHQGKRLTRKIK